MRRRILLGLCLAAPAAAAFARGGRALPLVRGEVIEIDAKERRLLVKHERIPNLGMDPMTMEFLVAPGEPLPALKPHDRIRFAARYAGGEYLITKIQPVKARAGK